MDLEKMYGFILAQYQNQDLSKTFDIMFSTADLLTASEYEAAYSATHSSGKWIEVGKLKQGGYRYTSGSAGDNFDWLPYE